MKIKNIEDNINRIMRESNWMPGLFLASAAITVFWWVELFIMEYEGSNIWLYVKSLLIFASALIISLLLNWQLHISGKLKVRNKITTVIALLDMLLWIVMLYYAYLADDEISGAINMRSVTHLYPDWIIILFIIIVALWILTKLRENGTHSVIGEWIFYVGMSVLYAISKSHVGTISDSNADAYLQSILNCVNNYPFKEDTVSNYGHYGLFFLPLLKLFGGNYFTMVAIISCISFAVFLGECYIIHKCIKRTILRYFGVMALLDISLVFLDGYYWQSNPHREVAPTVMIIFILLVLKYPKVEKAKNGLLFCVSVACILWNTETGIVAAFGRGVFEIIYDMKGRGICTKQLIKSILYEIFVLAGELVAVVLVVNLWNYLCGYRYWEIKSVFAPAFGNSSVFTIPMKWENGAFLYCTPLLLICFCISLKRTIYQGDYIDNIMPIVSFMGLGLNIYYINRFVWCNAFISLLEQVLCWGYIIDMCMKSWELRGKIETENIIHYTSIGEGVSNATMLGAVLIFAYFGVASIWGIDSLAEKYNDGAYDAQAVHTFAAEVEKTIPQNTFAYGCGTGEVYSLLGWDSGYHARNVKDILSYEEEYERNHELVLGQTDIFAGDSYFVNELLADEDYTIMNVLYDGYGSIYYYFVKNPYADASDTSAFETAFFARFLRQTLGADVSNEELFDWGKKLNENDVTVVDEVYDVLAPITDAYSNYDYEYCLAVNVLGHSEETMEIPETETFYVGLENGTLSRKDLLMVLLFSEEAKTYRDNIYGK